MLNMVICEDNQPYAKYLADIFVEFLEKEGVEGRIACVTDNPEEAARKFTSEKCNLMFVDIALNGVESGYELASQVQQKHRDAYIVFISEHLEYVFKAFKVRAFDFLPKPATKAKIFSVLERILNEMRAAEGHAPNEVVTIKSNGLISYLPKRDLIMIEKMHNKAILHTEKKQVSCYESLENFQSLLSDAGFARVHRSYLINKRMIESIDLKRSEIHLKGGLKCLIGNTYKKEVTTLL